MRWRHSENFWPSTRTTRRAGFSGSARSRLSWARSAKARRSAEAAARGLRSRSAGLSARPWPRPGGFGEGDPAVAGRWRISLRDVDSFADDQKVELHFALAKAYDDLQRCDAAFEQWQKGNAIKRGLITYDEASSERFFDEAAAAFTPALVQANRKRGDPVRTSDIFIVGMPRSGTSSSSRYWRAIPRFSEPASCFHVNDLIAGDHAGGDYPSASRRFQARRFIASANSIRSVSPPLRPEPDVSSTSCRPISVILG